MNRKLTIILAVAVVTASLLVGNAAAAPERLGGPVHMVQWGENLATIALRYGISMEALAAANGISDPNLIYIGQELVVPSAGAPQPSMQAAAAPAPAVPAAPAPLAAAPAASSYNVQYGDTLTSIAGRFGCTVEDLIALNGLRDRFIYIGQQLNVPQAGAGPQFVPGPVAANPAPGAMHTVQPGETLSALAYRYGTSVNDIMQQNNLHSPWILEGQRLVIPGQVARGIDQPPGSFYTVQVGDTLAGIALRHGTSVASILQANNLPQAGFIFPGQELVIPGKVQPVEQPLEQMQMMPAPAAPSGITKSAKPRITQPASGAGGPDALIIAPIVGDSASSAAAPADAAPMVSTAPELLAVASGQSFPLESTAPEIAMVQGQSNAPGAPMTAPSLEAPLLGGSPSGPFVGQAGFYQPDGYKPQFPGPGPVILSSAAPVKPEITTKWEGRVVSQTFPEGKRYPAVLRVVVGGAKDMQVTIRKKDSNWSTTGFTGTKPEYGEGAVEFAPLNPGTHIITLDGQGASMQVNIKANSLTYVEFARVPANSGP